jgi:hypothetical protein
MCTSGFPDRTAYHRPDARVMLTSGCYHPPFTTWMYLPSREPRRCWSTITTSPTRLWRATESGLPELAADRAGALVSRRELIGQQAREGEITRHHRIGIEMRGPPGAGIALQCSGDDQ